MTVEHLPDDTKLFKHWDLNSGPVVTSGCPMAASMSRNLAVIILQGLSPLRFLFQADLKFSFVLAEINPL